MAEALLGTIYTMEVLTNIKIVTFLYFFFEIIIGQQSLIKTVEMIQNCHQNRANLRCSSAGNIKLDWLWYEYIWIEIGNHIVVNILLSVNSFYLYENEKQ